MMRYKPIIPQTWSEDLAYLFGLILGDGSMPKTSSLRPNGKRQIRYLITFVCESKEFLEEVYIPIFYRLFGIKPYVCLHKEKKNPLYECKIESIELYSYLVKLGYIPGRKAKIAKVPLLPQDLEVFLLAGLLDTDGGKKGNGFGLSSASEHLAQFCISVFKRMEIPFHSCPWRFKDHTYHQIYTSKINMWKVLKSIPLRNREKIEFLRSSQMPQ